MTHNEFIEKIADCVDKYAYLYGIEVHSPIIAQAILESGWGTSSLASKYHNYFGMKCGSSWKGKSVNFATKEEYTAGTLTKIRDNFRVYDSMELVSKVTLTSLTQKDTQILKGLKVLRNM